jgi:DNA-binding response OmpR family regulator
MSPAEVIPFPDRSGRHATILIVEQEPLIRMAVSDHLQNEKFKTLEASDSVEGMEILGSEVAFVDLVVADVRAHTGGNGLALYDWMKVNRKALPLILTSSGFAKGLDVETLAAPYFRKPYSLEALTRKIRQMLRQTRQI